VLDRAGAEALAAGADGGTTVAVDPRRLRVATERCEDTRKALEVNVTEDLALEALGFRLARLVGATR
jgi:hypothetical protein